MIRLFEESDLNEVIALWGSYNKDDVFLPDLIRDKNVSFKNVYLDKNGKIIGFTCINMIPELILVHNKSLPANEKYEMLFRFFTLNKHWCSGQNYKQLYAFISTDNWIRHLKSIGFKLYEKGIYYLNLR